MKNFRFAGWAVFISVIVVIAGSWFLLRHFQQRSEAARLDPFSLVPSDAWLVLDLRQTRDMNSFFMVDSLLWNELKPFGEVAWLRRKLSAIDSLFSDNTEMLKALHSSRVVVSLHTAIRGQSPVLLQIRPATGVGFRQFERAIVRQLMQAGGYSDFRYLGVTIHQLKLLTSEKEQTWWFAFYKGSLLGGPSQRLVEHAITHHLAGSSLDADHHLGEIRSAAGRRTNHIFLDGSRLCEVMKPLLADVSSGLFPCHSFSGWLGWDFSLLDDEIRFTGLALAHTMQPDFLGLLSRQKAADPFLLHLVPSASAAMAILNLNPTEELVEDLATFRQINGISEDLTHTPTMHLAGHLGNAMAEVLLYSPGLTPAESVIALVHLKDGQGLMEKLAGLEAGEPRGMALNAIDTVFDKVIWNLPGKSWVGPLTMGLISREMPFFALTDTVLVAGTSAQAVNRALMQIFYGQVIAREPRLREDFIFQQPASTLLYLLNIPYLTAMLYGNWSPKALQFIGQIGQGAWPLDRLTAQFSAHRQGLFFSNISLHRHGAKISGLQKPLWQLSLDTAAVMAPAGVFNHHDGSREIVIQDLANNFCLIDRFGKILWKKQINGAINSPVYQVDRYKNGRYQYLFSTRNHLHLIDRNGNYVRGYPVRLPAAAPNGITLADYDLNKDYRILFAGENRRVYNLLIDGARVIGWQTPELEKPAAGPLQYLRLAKRDYLVVVDQEGKPYFFDRRGQLRLKIGNDFRISAQNPFVYTGNQQGESFFVALSDNGEILEINPDGEVSSFNVGPSEKPFGFMLAQDKDSGENIFLLAGETSIGAFDRLGRELFSISLPGKVILPIILVKAAGKHFTGVRTHNPDLLYLFDMQGNLMAPFPLAGDQMFMIESLFQDQAWNVVTAEKEKVTAFLIGGL